MEKIVKSFRRRLSILAGLGGLVLVVFLVTLYSAQVVHGGEYRAKSIASNAT